jgi:hypothetical protein
MQIGLVIFARNVQRQLLEDVGTKAEGTVNVAFRRCRFSGMRFIAIDEEHVASRSCVLGSPIGVLLNAFLDKTDYKMLMRMTCKSVLDVVRMNDLGFVWMGDAIDANPLGSAVMSSICHTKSLNKPLYSAIVGHSFLRTAG